MSLTNITRGGVDPKPTELITAIRKIPRKILLPTLHFFIVLASS